MKDKKVFARPAAGNGYAVINKAQEGMTLREHYAGLAMQALIQTLTEEDIRNSSRTKHVSLDHEVIAKESVSYADALLESL